MTTVNIVILDTPTAVRGIEWGLAIGEAPDIDTDPVCAWLAEHGAWDTPGSDIYPLVVLEEDWDSAAFAGCPYYELEIPAVQADALDAAIAPQED